MTSYTLRRAAWMIVDLWIVLTITFVLSYLLPGDPARTIAGPHASMATIDRIRRQLGLDRPLTEQYGLYLWHIAHLNFGTSIQYGIPVWQAIIRRAPATALLAAAALAVEFVLGMLLGLLSVWRPGNWLDKMLSNISMALVALPQFWMGLLLIFVFAFRFQWFPLGGIGQPLGLYVFLPALTIGLGGAAYYHQLITARMQDILHEDYIRTAYAKGAGRMRVLRHALAVMWPTLLTQIGMDFGYFMAGVVVVETVFGWPGIGLQAWEAIQALDVPLIMGTVIFGAFWIILANFLVDMLYALIDPRIRVQSSRGA